MVSDLTEKMIDISVELSKQSIIYPGDSSPDIGLTASLANGDSANVGYMNICLHHGTHVDAPYHYLEDGLTINKVPLDHWVGPVLVADLTKADKCIRAADLDDLPLAEYSRVLFKTKNSLDLIQRKTFSHDFIYLAPDACQRLVESGVKTVGIDYLTIDPVGGQDYPAHRTLLGHGVCIIEYINLKHVKPGVYYLLCLPLKLTGTDGAPARVLLMDLDTFET